MEGRLTRLSVTVSEWEEAKFLPSLLPHTILEHSRKSITVCDAQYYSVGHGLWHLIIVCRSQSVTPNNTLSVTVCGGWEVQISPLPTPLFWNILECRSRSVGGHGGGGSKFLPLYTSTLLLDRVSQNRVSIFEMNYKFVQYFVEIRTCHFFPIHFLYFK